MCPVNKAWFCQQLRLNYCGLVHISEIRFPELGVRFIAINDGVDSEDQSTNDFTPFRNIMKNKRCLGGGTTNGDSMNISNG